MCKQWGGLTPKRLWEQESSDSVGRKPASFRRPQGTTIRRALTRHPRLMPRVPSALLAFRFDSPPDHIFAPPGSNQRIDSAGRSKYLHQPQGESPARFSPVRTHAAGKKFTSLYMMPRGTFAQHPFSRKTRLFGCRGAGVDPLAFIRRGQANVILRCPRDALLQAGQGFRFVPVFFAPGKGHTASGILAPIGPAKGTPACSAVRRIELPVPPRSKRLPSFFPNLIGPMGRWLPPVFFRGKAHPWPKTLGLRGD